MTKTDLEQVLAHAQALCARRGVRLTALRRRALMAVAEAGAPVKAYDLLPVLGGPNAPAKPATAYRALQFLQDLGLVHRVAGLNAYVACVHGGGPHVTELFVCERCGATAEQRRAALTAQAPQGFVVRRSVLEHYGCCRACAADSAGPASDSIIEDAAP